MGRSRTDSVLRGQGIVCLVVMSHEKAMGRKQLGIPLCIQSHVKERSSQPIRILVGDTNLLLLQYRPV